MKNLALLIRQCSPVVRVRNKLWSSRLVKSNLFDRLMRPCIEIRGIVPDIGEKLYSVVPDIILFRR